MCALGEAGGAGRKARLLPSWGSATCVRKTGATRAQNPTRSFRESDVRGAMNRVEGRTL